MADSATESSDSEESDKSPPEPKVVIVPVPPIPVFKPSPATDNDTYFDRHFKPLNGDIVLSNKLEYEPKDPKAKKKKTKKGEPPPLPVLIRRAVTLFNDEFDQTQLQPGDFILRLGLFELKRCCDPDGGEHTVNEWCWKDLEMATIHVYWPNYHSKGHWFKVATFPLFYCLGPIIEPDAFRMRRDFKEDPNFKESIGNIIVRRIKIQDPTRPWGWTFAAWQLQEYWDETKLHASDIVVHACGHYFSAFRGRAEEREPVFKLKEALFRLEVDCAWYDQVIKKWFYGGQDVFCYKVKANEFWITQERFHAVPKPGDILITQGNNLLRPLHDMDYSKGGYVQVYNDKRFFYPGDPPLRAVNVKGPGNMAIRFGHFDQHWDWTPLPTLQLFHFHEKEGAWYTLGPVLLTYKWMVAPDYRFELSPIELNSVVEDLLPREGDIIIRKPRPPPPKVTNPLIEKPSVRTGSYFKETQTQAKPDPFWNRIMKIVPYDARVIHQYPLVAGDCLLRAGIEPAGPLSTAKYNATAELYMLILDHWDRLVWTFRGRDKVFFGDPPAEPHYEDESTRGEEPVMPKVGQKRDLSIPTQPRLVSRKLRPSPDPKRKVADVLIERSVWNNPGSVMVSPDQFRYLITVHDMEESFKFNREESRSQQQQQGQGEKPNEGKRKGKKQSQHEDGKPNQEKKQSKKQSDADNDAKLKQDISQSNDQDEERFSLLVHHGSFSNPLTDGDNQTSEFHSFTSQTSVTVSKKTHTTTTSS